MTLRIYLSLVGTAAVTLALYLSLEPWSAEGAAAIAVMAGLGVAAALTRLLLRPIRRAADVAADLARTAEHERLPETEPGALGALYRSLNRVAEELDRRMGALEADVAENELLLREMGEGVLALSPEGTVVRANAALTTAVGGSNGMEGKAVGTVFRNPSLVRFLTPGSLPSEGAEGEFEVFDRTMLVSARQLPAGGLVAVFSDLTPIRRLERIRTEFVANASHELKTPLTAVRGYAETLLELNPEAEDRKDFARRIVEHAGRMSAIVDDLLTLAQLEGSGRPVRRASVAVKPLIVEIWEARPKEERRDIELAIDVEPEDLAVMGDSEGVRQIVENLLDNALRHSNASTVGVKASPSDGAVRITVWDRGQGIPSAHLGRIFERFYRVDPSRSRASGGTGLGLSIVKHWTESMGGRTWAESTVGRGTRFHVELPGGEAVHR